MDVTPSIAGTSLTEDGQRRLQELAVRLDVFRKRLDVQKDSRAVFTFTYVLITRHLADALPTAHFADPAWIVRLAEHFAGKYIDALEAADQGSALPAAWDEVFKTIRDARTTVLEDMLFAITAHIVHDLPLALTEVGLTDFNQVSHIHDFQGMNDVLATNIQKITDSVTRRYEPFFGWLDHLEERYAQILTDYGFRISRGVAWYNAVRLLDPTSTADAARAINQSVQILVGSVRRPPVWSLRLVMRGLRWIAALFRRWPKP